MANDSHLRPQFQEPNFTLSQHDRRSPQNRPVPLRVRTFSDASPGNQEPAVAFTSPLHPRSDRDRAMEGAPVPGARSRNSPASFSAASTHYHPPRLGVRAKSQTEATTITEESPRTSLEESSTASVDGSGIISPPGTPSTVLSASERGSLEICTREGSEVLVYDFSRIDYQLERARVLGRGLWSTVYLAEQMPVSASTSARLIDSEASPLTPPSTPRRARDRNSSMSGLVAVKLPARPDAQQIFLQEARVLTHLQRDRDRAGKYVVQFRGLDKRNQALLFEAVIGGSLENLCGRLKQMTEISRHVELINIFPRIANDLISGLAFIQANGVVHADIKPSNVLLDIHELNANLHMRPVIRARLIDFSAAFIPGSGDDASNAGGTWDYMAPEQMRILQKDMCTPTFASDVWSLGITLASIIVGESPYTAACAGNMFRLREAVKSGDPLRFARMDPVAYGRLAACQDLVDCCRLALKKDRENRVTAAAWAKWMQDRRLES